VVRSSLARHQGREVKMAGDGFLATFDATGRALRRAVEILAGAKDMGLDLRAGVHSGDVEVRSDDIALGRIDASYRAAALTTTGVPEHGLKSCEAP
jgi:class 3 adenylate cyclase